GVLCSCCYSSMYALLPSMFSFMSCLLDTDLLSFPTRRSSDLASRPSRSITGCRPDPLTSRRARPARPRRSGSPTRGSSVSRSDRSEEHTSELQSRFDLVCRLLLEKKKTSQQILHMSFVEC